MDINEALEIVYTHASQGTASTRREIFRRILECFPEEELKNSITTMVRHRRRKVFKGKEPGGGAGAVLPLGGHPSSKELSPPAPRREPWFSHFGEKIVGFDCEMVSVPLGSPTDIKVEVSRQGHVRFISNQGLKLHFRQSAATVGLAFQDGRRLAFRIKHEKDTFLVNPHTIKLTGFKRDSLANGDSLEKVRQQLLEAIEGHLIVTHTGAADFSSMGLSPGDFIDQWFELTTIFKRDAISVHKLKTIYDQYYPGNQLQTGIHDALEDAVATLDIFNVCKKLCNDHGIYDRSTSYRMDDNFVLSTFDSYQDEFW